MFCSVICMFVCKLVGYGKQTLHLTIDRNFDFPPIFSKLLKILILFNLKLLKEIQGFFSVTRFTYIAEDNYAKPQFICVAQAYKFNILKKTQ